MATEVSIGPIPYGKSRPAAGEPRDVWSEPSRQNARSRIDGSVEVPELRRYPGYVRLAILIVGALASWAVVGGVAALLL